MGAAQRDWLLEGLAGGPRGGWNVLANHTYTEEGTASIAVVLGDVGGAASVSAAGSTFTISDAPLATTVTVSGGVATFSNLSVGLVTG